MVMKGQPQGTLVNTKGVSTVSNVSPVNNNSPNAKQSYIPQPFPSSQVDKNKESNLLTMYSSVPATQSFINVGSSKAQKGVNIKGSPNLLTFPAKGITKNIQGDVGLTNSPSITNLSPQSTQKKLFPYSPGKQ